MNTVTLYGALEQVRISLSEIFYSVQGEGKYLGMPTIFFRFNKCNIKCGYCDTDFKKIGYDNVESMIEKIAYIIRNNPVRHVCFTGGEPLLFKEQINAILELLEEELFFTDYTVKIETNGLLKLPRDLSSSRDIIFTVTPKFDHLYEYDPANFEVGANEIIFKFMMSKDFNEFNDQLTLIQDFLMLVSIFDPDIYFAPINRTGDDILFNYKKVMKNYIKLKDHPLFASEYMKSFRGITVQLHKLLEWK